MKVKTADGNRTAGEKFRDFMPGSMQRAIKDADKTGDYSALVKKCAKSEVDSDVDKAVAFLAKKGEEGAVTAWTALNTLRMLREEDTKPSMRFSDETHLIYFANHHASDALLGALERASERGEGEFVKTYSQIISAGVLNDFFPSWKTLFGPKESMDDVHTRAYPIAARKGWFDSIPGMVKSAASVGMESDALTWACIAVHDALDKVKDDPATKGKLAALYESLNNQSSTAVDAELKRTSAMAQTAIFDGYTDLLDAKLRRIAKKM